MGRHNRSNNSCVYTVSDNQVSLRANSGHYLSYTHYLLFLSMIAIALLCSWARKLPYFLLIVLLFGNRRDFLYVPNPLHSLCFGML